MNFKIFVFLLVMIEYINCDFDPDEMCSLLATNTKINDPRACNAWILCIDGAATYGTCDADQFYDRSKEACVPSDSIQCISTNPCAPLNGKTDFAADPYSCNGYYSCTAGSGSPGVCAEGKNFDPVTKLCIKDFPCTTKMDPLNYCNIVPEGIFIKNPNNCDGYELCWGNQTINGSCPYSLYFNALLGACDSKDNVDCTENVSTEEPPNADEICSTPDTFVPDGYSCNGYYYCSLLYSDMRAIHGECPEGRFFSIERGAACLARSTISCPFNRCVTLGSKNIQLANKYNDGCTGYLICQSGEEIGSGDCPDDMFFDELIQRCTTQTITYPACALSQTTTQGT